LSSLFGCSATPIKESAPTAYHLDVNLNRQAIDLYIEEDEVLLRLLLKADLWLQDHPMVLLPEEKQRLAVRIELVQAMLRRISLSQN
jgi:hypothetical protein